MPQTFTEKHNTIYVGKMNGHQPRAGAMVGKQCGPKQRTKVRTARWHQSESQSAKKLTMHSTSAKYHMAGMGHAGLQNAGQATDALGIFANGQEIGNGHGESTDAILDH
jgi:hypothetical protein